MRNINIDGKKLYGITNVVKKIKFGDCKDQVVKIEKDEKGIYASLVKKSAIWSTLGNYELSIEPELLLDPKNYNDYDLMETKPEPTYAGVRRLLIEFVIHWDYEVPKTKTERMLVFAGIFESALLGTNFHNKERLEEIRMLETRLWNM